MITEIVFNLLFAIIDFLWFSLILSAVISLLLAFNVLDRHNRMIWSVADFLYRVTDPMLRPIRRFLPNFNGVDLSPWVALIFLQIVVKPIVAYVHIGVATGMWPPLF